MPTVFKHIALVGKTHAQQSRQVLLDIAQFISGLGCEVSFESQTASHNGIHGYDALGAAAIGKQCDLSVVVGGDGTMLGIARELAPFGVPLVGVNQGRLGFITDIALGDYRNALPRILEGEYEEERRPLMQASVYRDSHVVFDSLALNDVVVNRGSTAGMIEIRVSVDGHFVANHRADGLIVASATGSTAYALSAGGPLLHPAIGGWVMVPIAPHTLSNRPIVLSDQSEIALELVAGRDASANFDMHSLAELMHGDRILVSRSKYAACFLHPKGWSYYDTLRKKLHWNEG
jgi:NAD+ kinase